MLPKGDRRPTKIGEPYRPMRAVGTMEEDGREIAGIVGDAQRPIEPTRPEAEHVVPIAQAEEMDAVALHPAPEARQEIDQERRRIMGVAQRIRPLGDRLVPGRPWRQAYPGMPLGVVARDFQRDPALQLVERHRRARPRVIVAAMLDIAERRSRQEMNRAHHRADQALDMAAIVRRGDGPVDKGNPIFLSAPPQSMREKILAVVDVNRVGKSGRRPIRVDVADREPSLLRQRQMLDCQRDGYSRGGLEGEMKSGDHAARDVDRQRQPWPLDGRAIDGIHDDQIHHRMIDLHDLERMVGAILTGDRPRSGPAPPSRPPDRRQGPLDRSSSLSPEPHASWAPGRLFANRADAPPCATR